MQSLKEIALSIKAHATHFANIEIGTFRKETIRSWI